MYLDNLLPELLGAFGSPSCLLKKLKYPNLVSYGLMANLNAAKRRKLIENIDAIVDVGANIGQYAYMSHSIWPGLPIFSFEPDPVCYGKLRDTFSQFRIEGACFETAISDRAGVVQFGLQVDRAQNSFLPRADVSGGHFQQIDVQCKTLDQVSDEIPGFHRSLLKIDTQGFELQAINGGAEFLRRCAYVQLEVSFISSYEGQPYASTLMAIMRESGFVCVEILDLLRASGKKGSPIREADLLFVRENPQSSSYAD